MVAALATRPTDGPAADEAAVRPSLADLAALSVDRLIENLQRALPGADSGQVAVAAFQSSI
ncbi:hypothetical protein KNE206_09670 [Kitasatospora sp. NE20-6]|uniref:hypothetical protein n=1 Tax=Kitasatospora sp. NE20-6 TaxID=2859066 RepID=UPI0034DC7CF7